MTQQTTIRRALFLGSPLVIASLLLGCGGGGPERGAIAGKVMLDGQPLPEGWIQFIPTEKTTGPASGAEIRDGEYAITPAQGPVVGSHRVEIHGKRKTGKKLKAIPPAPVGTEIEEVTESVPDRYHSDKSILRKDVIAGNNVFDVKLTSK